MSSRRFEERNIRKLTKIGTHSFGITLPVEFIRKLGWKERQKLVVRLRGEKISITDWKR